MLDINWHTAQNWKKEKEKKSYISIADSDGIRVETEGGSYEIRIVECGKAGNVCSRKKTERKTVEKNPLAESSYKVDISDHKNRKKRTSHKNRTSEKKASLQQQFICEKYLDVRWGSFLRSSQQERGLNTSWREESSNYIGIWSS